MSFDGKFIRGFVVPKFATTTKAKTTTTTQTVTVESSATNTSAASTTTTTSSKTETVGTGTLSKVAAGSKLKLVNTPMYASSSAKTASSKKSGVYYIWSVDTVNNRVRITNSKSNVGVKGQVTGWIDVTDAVATIVGTSTASTATASTPSYQVNAVYVTQVADLTVRKGPGTSYEAVGYSGLTANAKKYDKNKDGKLDKGTKVTCLEVKVVGTNVWIRIPSGWVAAFYNKKYYVK
jgi:hypothetical protein